MTLDQACRVLGVRDALRAARSSNDVKREVGAAVVADVSLVHMVGRSDRQAWPCRLPTLLGGRQRARTYERANVVDLGNPMRLNRAAMSESWRAPGHEGHLESVGQGTDWT